MPVATVLADSDHHAAPRGQKMARTREEVEPEQHEAPRRQEPRPPRVRLGSVAEPGPQRSDRSLWHSSGETLPTPGLPVLDGASGEAVDSSALSFLTAQAPEAKRKDEEEERTKKLEDLGQDVMLMAEAHELLLLGKPAWTAEQRARFRVLSTQITSKEASASSTPGRRKRKKRRKKKLPRISSFAHAARHLKSGVFSTGPLYLTVLCPVYWSYCGYMFIRQFTRAWNFTGFLHEGDQDPWTILA